MSTLGVGHASNVIARALIPIFGVMFRNWSETKLLVVYFADTVASLYASMMLVSYAGDAVGAESPTATESGQALTRRLRAGIQVGLPLAASSPPRSPC